MRLLLMTCSCLQMRGRLQLCLFAVTQLIGVGIFRYVNISWFIQASVKLRPLILSFDYLIELLSCWWGACYCCRYCVMCSELVDILGGRARLPRQLPRHRPAHLHPKFLQRWALKHSTHTLIPCLSQSLMHFGGVIAGASQVIAQYYQLIRLGFEVKSPKQACKSSSDRIGLRHRSNQQPGAWYSYISWGHCGDRSSIQSYQTESRTWSLPPCFWSFYSFLRTWINAHIYFLHVLLYGLCSGNGQLV